jgi:hypothetical protein
VTSRDYWEPRLSALRNMGTPPAAVRLRPNVSRARHGAESVVVPSGTAAVGPERTLAAEERLEFLFADLVPPARAL